MSANGDKAILVELKTESRSRRDTQDEYLLASRTAGLHALLAGVLDILCATTAKHKYFALLEHLESMGLVRIPIEMREVMSRPSLRGVTEASRGIAITTDATECVIVYVQPHGDGDGIISFDEFRAVVTKHDAPLSRRFAQSLSEWASVKAGETRSAHRPEARDGA